MADDQCKNTTTTALSAKGVYTPNSSNASRSSRERPSRDEARKFFFFFFIVLMRYETTVRTLWKAQKTRAELGCWDISLMKRHECTHTTQSCWNSGVKNIVPSHIMLHSRDEVAFIPSGSKSCRVFFYSQQHIHIAHRHNIDCLPDVGLLLSRVRLVVCCDCHVTNFARSNWVVS